MSVSFALQCWCEYGASGGRFSTMSRLHGAIGLVMSGRVNRHLLSSGISKYVKHHSMAASIEGNWKFSLLVR